MFTICTVFTHERITTLELWRAKLLRRTNFSWVGKNEKKTKVNKERCSLSRYPFYRQKFPTDWETTFFSTSTNKLFAIKNKIKTNNSTVTLSRPSHFGTKNSSPTSQMLSGDLRLSFVVAHFRDGNSATFHFCWPDKWLAITNAWRVNDVDALKFLIKQVRTGNFTVSLNDVLFLRRTGWLTGACANVTRGRFGKNMLVTFFEILFIVLVWF